MPTPSRAPVIPGSLNKDPQDWSPEDVLEFLEANKEKYFLYDKHIDLIRTNEVPGHIFLELTKNELLQSPYGLPGGPAATIVKLINELIRITEEAWEREQKEEAGPQTEDKAPTPTTPHPVPPSTVLSPVYKSKSSLMSSAWNQTRDNIYALLETELLGTIWRDVCFDGLFGAATDSPPVMAASTFSDWLSVVKSNDTHAFENYGTMWLQNFSEQVKAHGLIGDNPATERFYYSSGNIHLRDAYHGAQRKCDIVLTHKLDIQSHGLAIAKTEVGTHISGDTSNGDVSGGDVRGVVYPRGGVPGSDSNALTASDSGDKYQHSWKDVLVVGEFKANITEDKAKKTILQLSSYAREALFAQPGRRFFHAFSVCGHLARFYFFDRVGVSISTSYDISSEQDQTRFMHGLLSYMKMTPSQLGFDERYKDTEGNTFVPNGNGNHPGYLYVNDKRFELVETLHRTPAIASRATLCWLGRELEGGCSCSNGCNHCLCVIKEAWRDTQLNAESELWQLAKEKNVFGCLDILAAWDANVVSRCDVGQNPNNVRNCFDYTGANPVPDGTRTILATIHEDNKSARPSEILKGARMSRTTKKRSSCHNADSETPPRKKSKKCGVDVVEARTRTFLVIRNVGEKLNSRLQPWELVETLRDAIKCHRSLYEDAGILHCDISINNIMRAPRDCTSGLKGFLIDLDYARRLKPDLPIAQQSTCITGTAPFMALELLLESNTCHTWRHDLESFFYVLIWLCTPNPHITLEHWVHCLSNPANAKAKHADISSFFGQLINAFDRNFETLKGLATKYKNILFFETSANRNEFSYTTPGDSATIYNKVLTAFDDCIANLQPESQEEGDVVAEANRGAEASVECGQGMTAGGFVAEDGSFKEWMYVGKDTSGAESMPRTEW